MIGVAVVGYGYWGPRLVRSLSKVAGARLAAVVDVSPARRRRAVADGVAAPVEPALSVALRDPGIDAVVVATPLASHFTLAREALDAGRHVLVEKPFTATADEARRLIGLAADRGLVVMADHPTVHSGALCRVAELVHGGVLGPICHYDSVRVSDGRERHDADVLWDLASHDLANLDVLLPGGPLALSASGREDVAHLTAYYEDGAVAHIQVSWRSPVRVRQLVIAGGRARVAFDADGDPPVVVHEPGRAPWSPPTDPTEPLQLALASFVGAIASGSSGGEDAVRGLRVVRLLEGASASLRARGLPVEVDPP